MAGQLKTFLVVNPRSANGSTGRLFGDIRRAVEAAIGPFEHAFTTAPLEATALARRALLDGFELVVAVGGDGTANEVVNGFFDEPSALEGIRPVREGAALGIIPRGTGGDFRKVFGWGKGLEEAAARLKGDRCRRVDLGRIRFVDHQGRPASRYFLNVASAGLSGLVDHEVNHASKALGGRVSFIIGTFKGMVRWRDVGFRVSFDGAGTESFPATMVAVANGQYFGGGMWVAPAAAPDDGILDVTIWAGYRLRDFVTKAKAVYDGSHVRMPGTRTLKARKVEMASDAPEVLLDVDGEQPGKLPATLEILPGALQLKVAPE